MPWGSNITNSEVPIYNDEFQPGIWSTIGANRREEDKKNKAVMAVAEARKSIREKFTQGKVAENKKALTAEISGYEKAISELDKKMSDATGKVLGLRRQIDNYEQPENPYSTSRKNTVNATALPNYYKEQEAQRQMNPRAEDVSLFGGQ